MKKDATNTIRQFVSRLSAWVHEIIERKGQHISDCAWYPGPCQTEFPY